MILGVLLNTRPQQSGYIHISAYHSDADLSIKSKPLKRLSQKSIADIISVISKQRIAALDEAVLKIADKKIIYVINSGGKPTALNAARLLATQSARSGRNVVFCDTKGQSKKEDEIKETKQSSAWPIKNVSDNLSVMTDLSEAVFFTSKDFSSTLKNLTDQFDQVFLCSSNRNAQLGLMALKETVPSIVMVTGLRKTRKIDIQNIKLRKPIDLLFYD